MLATRAVKHAIARVNYFLNPGTMVYYSKSGNFGDSTGPYLVEKITKSKSYHYHTTTLNKIQKKLGLMPQLNYMVIGSILNLVDHDTVVWGAGFISEDSETNCKPHSIKAVRGPLSRKMLNNQGIDCPEVYGDPALLLPQILKPNIKKKYSLGLVPHYIEADHPYLDKFRRIDDVLFINVYDPVEKIINQILSCETVASSSLHGLIVADAYNIPATWIYLTTKVIGYGFKFRDYFKSINRADQEPLILKESSTLEDIYRKLSDEPIEFNPEKLMEASPF